MSLPGWGQTAALRLLVIGANGFIGGRLAQAARGRFTVIAAGRNHCEIPADITDPASVAAAFDSARPDVVALTAGLADIDLCERDPAKACETNVTGTRNVASECARTGARLLFTSSGAVFDGACLEYREDSLPRPANVYGASKAEAEQMVTELLPESVIVRLSLVLGFPVRPRTNALLEKLQSSWNSGETVTVPAYECRNAIDVDTAVAWMLDLAANPDAGGIFHLGSSEALSRYEIARALAHTMGYSPELVGAGQEPPAGRAPRGRSEFLNPVRIARFSSTPVPTCRQAVERCVHAVA